MVWWRGAFSNGCLMKKLKSFPKRKTRDKKRNLVIRGEEVFRLLRRLRKTATGFRNPNSGEVECNV